MIATGTLNPALEPTILREPRAARIVLYAWWTPPGPDPASLPSRDGRERVPSEGDRPAV